MNISIELLLEIIGALLLVLFLVFFMREKIVCWLFGFLGSMSSSVLFYMQQLYSESLLYVFYAGMAVYGFFVWKTKDKAFPIRKLRRMVHVYILLLGSILVWHLGGIMEARDAEKPYYDAFSTIFSIAATFLEIYKYLWCWIYWIILNIYTAFLYASQSLWILTALMLFYTYLSIVGWLSWNKRFKSYDQAVA